VKLEEVKIMGAEFRVFHVLAILSLLVLLFTGFGAFLGGQRLLIHVSLGISSLIILLGYGVYLIKYRKVRLFDGLHKTLPDQLKEAQAVLLNYAEGAVLPGDVKRTMGRYNVLASYASVLLTIAAASLAVSGISLTLLKPPNSLLLIMLRIHIAGVYLVAFFFLLHFSAVIMGGNRPLLRAVFTNGKVPLSWARDHMAKFLNKES
jgi:formate dehydrogenase subunit gamma